ncbi:MAG: hypothetical protein BYD32DRAFT_438191 [Podila humilis]|nr:MAG: hypothetical protein BYD32DRAFT_438191 [Podila humilis]
MFDVPELDNMLYMGLDRHSVVQCARVNKKWNKTVSPYVFQEIPRLPKKHHQEAFRRIVLEDYLQEQEKSPRPPSGPQLALAKYGHCVRRICNLNNILLYLKPPAANAIKASKTKKPAKTIKTKSTTTKVEEPSADDLLCHFLKRCRNLQQDELSLTKQHFELPERLGFMRHMSLTSIRTLSIFSGDSSLALTASTLQLILIGVSSSLESLTLSVSRLHKESAYGASQLTITGGDGQEKEKEDKLVERWIHFKTLKLLDIPDTDHAAAQGFWAWFWPTCSRHVTHLEFCAWGPRSVRSMSFGIGHMKYLEKAHFGRTETEDHVELEDDDLAVMIAAGAGAGQSWKDVRFKSTAKAGPAAFHALLQHASTLEELHFVRHAGSAATVALLATCQKLRVLAALDNKDRPNIQFPEVLAEDFIDWDAGTGMVRPWPCALTLETIQIKIRGMTRTSEAVNYVQLQGRVFQRLSRFVNLQVLWLGHDPKLTPVVKRRRQCATASDEDEDGDFYIDSEEDDDDEEEMEDPWSERQQDCLTMTWEAGVRPLARLEKLRELNLSRMDIEFEETVAHWIIMVLPNLRKIRGVENSVQAYSFLKQHHPKLIRY